MDFLKKLLGHGKEGADIPTVRVIDLDPLLAPITPESPSGEADLEYDPAFIDLEDKLKGTPEVEIGGKIVQEGRPPNWTQLKSEAITLLTRTHDLRVTIILCRALLQTDGLMGLRDGLKLIESMIEMFWDTLYPKLDPDDNYDTTQRINILIALNDFDTLIVPLMGVPLCQSSKMGIFALRDIHIAMGKLPPLKKDNKSAPTLAIIEAAFKDVEIASIQSTLAAVAESSLSILSIEKLLEEKIESAGPPKFEELRSVLQDIHHTLSQQLAQRGITSSSATVPETEQIGPSSVAEQSPPTKGLSAQGSIPMDSISDRQDVIRMLDKICLFYEKNEPASPVPLLLKRAKNLVEKNFLEIIQDMAPDSVAQMKKLLGEVK